MPKFTKKPITIEATQWFKNGDHPQDYADERSGLENGEMRTWTGAEVKALGWEGAVVRYFRRPDVHGHEGCHYCSHTMHEHGWIDTMEGGHIVCPGDWIITGIKGERYPCKPGAAMRERDAALAEVGRLRGVLGDLTFDYRAGEMVCRVCLYLQGNGHAEGCRLAAVVGHQRNVIAPSAPAPDGCEAPGNALPPPPPGA